MKDSPHRRFLALLVALLLLFVVCPVLRGMYSERFLYDGLLTVVFVAGLFVLVRDRRFRILGLVLGIPTVAGVWTDYIVPGTSGRALVVGFHAISALFLVFVVAAILRVIHRDESVSSDGIYGAFCGYLLVGLVFGHLYCVVETLVPGSFHGGGEFAAHLRDDGQRHFALTYFSLVTLTTVGFGDITPASAAARGLAVVEAVSGQFYVVVLLAGLIGKRTGQPPQQGTVELK